jgi:hypothetical protein
VNFRSFEVLPRSPPPPLVPPVPVLDDEPPSEPVVVVVVPPVPPEEVGTLAITRAVKVKSDVFGLLNLSARAPLS